MKYIWQETNLNHWLENSRSGRHNDAGTHRPAQKVSEMSLLETDKRSTEYLSRISNARFQSEVPPSRSDTFEFVWNIRMLECKAIENKFIWNRVFMLQTLRRGSLSSNSIAFARDRRAFFQICLDGCRQGGPHLDTAAILVWSVSFFLSLDCIYIQRFVLWT